MTTTALVVNKAAGRPDQACAAAVDLAREGILDDHVGGHLGVVAEGERVVTHFFDCTLPGYRGWRWAVTVARAPRSKHVTLCETVLLPGDEALLAPAWVPWQERLQPGDLGVGDLLPTRADDERLAPGYVLSDDAAVEEVSWELGLGRSRVMSRDGRADTAQRWYDGDHGPEAAISVAAPANARCGTCGFYLPLAGSLRLVFGACGNVFAPDDGRVVSADHGCGAHSEVLVETVAPVEELPTVYDDGEVEPVQITDADRTGSDEAGAPAGEEPEPEAADVRVEGDLQGEGDQPDVRAEGDEAGGAATGGEPAEGQATGGEPAEGQTTGGEPVEGRAADGEPAAQVDAAAQDAENEGAGTEAAGNHDAAADEVGAEAAAATKDESDTAESEAEQPEVGSSRRKAARVIDIPVLESPLLDEADDEDSSDS